MDKDFFSMIRRNVRPRQEWNPHWILKILAGVWTAAFGAVKIALGAVATVLMILLVTGFVFVGILGQYLESDILPESEDYVITGISDLEQTTFVYYVDNDGNIQELQELQLLFHLQEYLDHPLLQEPQELQAQRTIQYQLYVLLQG